MTPYAPIGSIPERAGIAGFKVDFQSRDHPVMPFDVHNSVRGGIAARRLFALGFLELINGPRTYRL